MRAEMDRLGAILAILFFVSAMLVFIFRLVGRPQYAHRTGWFEFLLVFPLVYLLLKAPQHGRPLLYYIQIGCILAWLAVEAWLDYIRKLDFRKSRWIVIGYVVLFFAGSGGLLGLASNAGTGWILVAGLLFIAMAVLTFVQRRVTGQ